MTTEPTDPSDTLRAPEVSASDTTMEALLEDRALDAPPRPGVLASLDRFEILQEIGIGGMSVVFLAREPTTGGRVAIKLLRPELSRDPKIVRRFLTEAKHMYRLDHGNVLRVLEVSDRTTGPYYVMPYKPRGTLADLIKPGEPLDSETVLDLARQVASGLRYAHEQGLIHRDVKPANVLLDPDGSAYVSDFGMVRSMENDSIVTPGREGRLGTLVYMSPAVARGEAEDTRCDIYSFGALLYEMLTGRPPYDGPTREIVFQQILTGPPTPILQRNPRASGALATVAEGCMARELRERYASMQDVLDDLERIASGEGPHGPHGTTRSERRRGQLVGGLIGAAAVALVAVAIWQFWPRTDADARDDRIASASTAATDVENKSSTDDGVHDLRDLGTSNAVPDQTPQPGPTSLYPLLLRSLPDNGATGVNPGIKEIVVEFDRDMERGFSWCGEGSPSFPETTGRPYWRTHRSCVLPVELKPDRVYSLGINCPSAQNFRDKNGTPLQPIQLTFQTAGTVSQTLSLYPEIVRTTPASGATNVDPTTAEIVIEFDRDMEQGWSWCGGGPSYPTTTASAFWRTPRICVLPVELEPNHVYALSVNCPAAKNFRSRDGAPVKPYPLTFDTGPAP